MNTTTTRSIFSFLLLASAIGCGQTTGQNVAAQSALDQNFGALSEDATLPEDGETDDAVATAAEEEAPAEATDTDDSAPTLPPELVAQTKALYALRLAWGNFPANPDLKGQPVDYSGTITISEGALIGVRGVRLERRGQGDGIARPRTDKAVVDITSTITTAVDGVHLLIAAASEDASLTITLGSQYSETISLAGLKELVKTVPSATTGQEVRIALHKVRKSKVPQCTSGTLLGRWVHKSTPNGREFNTAGGFLLNDAGERIGRFFALAGQNKAGEPVLFIKMLSRGHFLARGKGTYDTAAKTFDAKLFHGNKEVGATNGNYTEISADAGYGEVTGAFSVGDCTAE